MNSGLDRVIWLRVPLSGSVFAGVIKLALCTTIAEGGTATLRLKAIVVDTKDLSVVKKSSSR
jgi:hypothetical protein